VPRTNIYQRDIWTIFSNNRLDYPTGACGFITLRLSQFKCCGTYQNVTAGNEIETEEDSRGTGYPLPPSLGFGQDGNTELLRGGQGTEVSQLGKVGPPALSAAGGLAFGRTRHLAALSPRSPVSTNEWLQRRSVFSVSQRPASCHEPGGCAILPRRRPSFAALGTCLGTTSLVLNADGTVHSEARHYPYGQERWRNGTFPTDYRFTGQRSEAGLGLVHMGARFYDSYIGRWISADTIVPEPGNPQTFNRYSYVRNSPPRYRDPTGHQSECAWWDLACWAKHVVNQIRDAVNEWWAYHNPCGMSVNPMCQMFSFSVPEVEVP
jgi:RHS repeat-associated protein